MLKNMESINIKKIAESGQCFRVLKIGDKLYRAVHKGEYIELYIDSQGNLKQYSCDKVTWNSIWEEYFDVNNIKDSVSAYSDLALSARHYSGIGSEYINEAVKAWAGLKILKQYKWETLISYIISQRNNIKKISNTVEELCRRLGEKKTDRFTGKTYYTCPFS